MTLLLLLATSLAGGSYPGCVDVTVSECEHGLRAGVTET